MRSESNCEKRRPIVHQLPEAPPPPKDPPPPENPPKEPPPPPPQPPRMIGNAPPPDRHPLPPCVRNARRRIHGSTKMPKMKIQGRQAPIAAGVPRCRSLRVRPVPRYSPFDAAMSACAPASTPPG